jgi:TPR repeat protein
MNIRRCVSSLAVGLMGTLEVSAAEISSLKILASDAPRPVALGSGISIAPRRYRNGLDERELSALNLLGIRYAKGERVKRNPGLAMRFFLRSAMRGYTPATASVGTLY